jgi:hypothetical protein
MGGEDRDSDWSRVDAGLLHNPDAASRGRSFFDGKKPSQKCSFFISLAASLVSWSEIPLLAMKFHMSACTSSALA